MATSISWLVCMTGVCAPHMLDIYYVMKYDNRINRLFIDWKQILNEHANDNNRVDLLWMMKLMWCHSAVVIIDADVRIS